MEFNIGELRHPSDCKRIYPKDVLEKAVQNYNGKTYKFGELGHPTTQNVELYKVSHVAEDVKIEDENFKVNVELLGTEKGKVATEFLNAGGKLKIRPRMLVNTEKVKKGPGKHTNKEVVKEMDIISWDLVY